MIRLAVIGMGGRAASLVKTMRNIGGDVKVVAVVDPDAAGAKQRLAKIEIDEKDIRFFGSTQEWMNEADQSDAVLVGTRCNMHTDVAVAVESTGLPLFLEKPVAITEEQLGRLYEAYQHRLGPAGKVVVSFPLRVTPLFLAVHEVVKSGLLGEINQIQAINNVPYGGVYYSEPYREFDLTGGLWLQKATHDFDYINVLVNSKATAVAATRTQKIFGHRKPHDLMCSKCDETETCLESPENLSRRGNRGGIAEGDHPCVFGDKIRNHDAGSALLEYENRINVTYSQNFATRRNGKRGAIITGYGATVEFDWYTEKMKVVHHHSSHDEEHVVKTASGHMGGDAALARNFIGVVEGREESKTDMWAGLVSAAMCMAALNSCHEKRFASIPLGDRLFD